MVLIGNKYYIETWKILKIHTGGAKVASMISLYPFLGDCNRYKYLRILNTSHESHISTSHKMHGLRTLRSIGSTTLYMHIAISQLLSLKISFWLHENQSQGNLKPLLIGRCPFQPKRALSTICHDRIFNQLDSGKICQ